MISIPEDKIVKYRDAIKNMTQASWTTLREVRSLIGKLLFVTNVVTVGRCFLRRLINLTRGLLHPAAKIKVTGEVKADLYIWLKFLSEYNGKNIIATAPVVTADSLHFYTDSSKKGYAGVFGSNYICGRFPAAWRKFSIQLLELFPIFALLHLFGSRLAHCEVIIHWDNKSVVYNINSQTSKNNRIMKLLRPMILLMLKHQCNLKPYTLREKRILLQIDFQGNLSLCSSSEGVECRCSPSPAGYVLTT